MKKTHAGKIRILKIQKEPISKMIFYRNQNKIQKTYGISIERKKSWLLHNKNRKSQSKGYDIMKIEKRQKIKGKVKTKKT